MSQSYSSGRRAGGRNIVPTRAAIVKQQNGSIQLVNGIGGPSTSNGSSTKVTIVETVGDQIVSRIDQDSSVPSGNSNSNNAIQLMGINNSSSLPSSNLYVNYPHTMWERDAEGNRIPITVLKAETTTTTDDLLSQAAASIKNDDATSPTRVTITMPSTGTDGQAGVVSPTSSNGLAQGSRIIVAKQNSVVNNGGPATTAAVMNNSVIGSGSGELTPRPHVCEVCTKTFAKREHLTKHLRIHKSDNKRYSCEYCQKAFRDRYELVRHTRRHTGDFPFRCQECNKGFMRHERYMTHLRWHSGERPYLCSMCEKSFRDRSELNRHSRRHTGDLPYKCETCGKGFLRRERYVTHVRIHTGEKPFVCAVCSRGYRDRRELKKHQTTHNHSGQSAPIPGSGPVTIPPPNAPSASSVGTKTIVVQPPVSPPQAIQLSSPTNTASVSLPSAPVPKELLNINLNGQAVVVKNEPLNPATIALPPSVASALQQINDKVTARQQRQKQLQDQQQQQVLVKPEPLIMLQDADNNSSSGGGGGGGGGGNSNSNNSNGPLFLYLMPNSVQYSLAPDNGTTVQVKTSDGSIAHAQLMTVPSSALQSITGGSNITTTTTTSTLGAAGGNLGNYILETSPSSSAASISSSRNSM